MPKQYYELDLSPNASPADCAEALYNAYSEVEPMVTEALVAIAESLGAQMAGLEFRRKTLTSLARKIATDAALGKTSPVEAANQIGDVIRYTFLFSSEEYAQRTRSALLALREEGLLRIDRKLRNYWLDPIYRGVNGAFGVMHNGVSYRFELQFHTPESHATKEQNHLLYEVYRSAAPNVTIEDKRDAWYVMRNSWSFVPRPAWSSRIPGRRMMGKEPDWQGQGAKEADLLHEDYQAEYFIFTIWTPSHPDYMRPLSLSRINGLGTGERWEGRRWQNDPTVYEAYGFGGDTDFQRVVSSRLADVLRYFGVPDAEGLARAAAYCEENAVWEDGSYSTEDELWEPVDRWIRGRAG